MSVEANKAVAIAFIDAINGSDWSAIERHIVGGMVWWNSSLGELQGQVIGILKAMEDVVDGKMTVTVKQITAQDDRVAIEAESYARLESGAIYNNFYHFLFQVDGDRVARLHEYADTKHAFDVLSDLLV